MDLREVSRLLDVIRPIMLPNLKSLKVGLSMSDRPMVKITIPSGDNGNTVVWAVDATLPYLMLEAGFGSSDNITVELAHPEDTVMTITLNKMH